MTAALPSQTDAGVVERELDNDDADAEGSPLEKIEIVRTLKGVKKPTQATAEASEQSAADT